MDVKVLVNVNIIFTIIFGILICKEKVHTREVIGIFITIPGVIVVGLFAETEVTTPNYVFFLWFAIIDFAVIILGLFLFYSKKGSYEYVYPIFCAQFFIIGNVANKILLQDLTSLDLSLTISILQNPFLYIFLLSYLVGVLLNFIGLSKGARAGIFSLLLSIFTTLLSILVGYGTFGEQLTFQKICGFGLILVGIGFIYSKQSNSSITQVTPEKVEINL